jgi:hypothetical protein
MRRGRRVLWLRLGFALAILITAIFALRALWFVWELAVRPLRPVAGWMTPRYIERVYDIDPADLARVLDFAPGEDPRESVTRLATRAGRDPAAVLAEIEALVDARRDEE